MQPRTLEHIGADFPHRVALVTVMGMFGVGMLAMSTLWMPALRSNYDTYPKLMAVALGTALLLAMCAGGYLPTVRRGRAEGGQAPFTLSKLGRDYSVAGEHGWRPPIVLQKLFGPAGRPGAFPVLVILYLAWVCASAFWAPDGIRAMAWRNIPFTLIYVAPCLMVRRAIRSLRDFHLLVSTYLFFAAAAAVFGLLDNAGLFAGYFSPYRGTAFPKAVQRPFGNTNFTAPLLLPAAAVLITRVFVFALSSEARAQAGWKLRLVLSVAALVPILGAVYLAGALSGYLGLAACVVLLPLWLWRGKARLYLLGGAFLIAVLAGYLCLCVGPIWNGIWQRAMAPNSTASTRMFYSVSAMQMFAKRPLTGWGQGTFLSMYPFFELPTVGDHFWTRGWATADVHNEYLQILVELGAVGLLLFGLAVCHPLWRAHRLLNEDKDAHFRTTALALAVGLIGTLVANVFSVSLRFWDVAPFFWMLLGALAASTEPLTDTAESGWKLTPGPSGVRPVRVLVWLSMLCVFLVPADVFWNDYSAHCMFYRAGRLARGEPRARNRHLALVCLGQVLSPRRKGLTVRGRQYRVDMAVCLNGPHYLAQCVAGANLSYDLFRRHKDARFVAISLRFLERARLMAPLYAGIPASRVLRLLELNMVEEGNATARQCVRQRPWHVSSWQYLSWAETARAGKPTPASVKAARIAAAIAMQETAYWRQRLRSGRFHSTKHTEIKWQLGYEIQNAAEACATAGRARETKALLDMGRAEGIYDEDTYVRMCRIFGLPKERD